MPSTCRFPFTHPLYAGPSRAWATPIRQLLMQHDLLFSVGADLFTLSLPSDVEPMPDGLPVVHLDLDPWEIGKNYPAEVAIQGDPKATLPELAEALRGAEPPAGPSPGARAGVARAARGRRGALLQRAVAQAPLPIHPLSLVHAVAGAMPAGATIVDESVSSGHGVRDLLRAREDRGFYGLRGGGIGWGLPAALGVKLALPDRPVIALVGDGSAMYTIQGLWTAAHDALAVVVVIFNNQSYRILKQRTLALKGFSAEDDRYVGMDLDQPPVDFVGLAALAECRASGWRRRATSAPALGRGLASGGPYLIDARLDGSPPPVRRCGEAGPRLRRTPSRR